VAQSTSTPDRDVPVGEPNLELVRRSGWNVTVAYGHYCVAWRNRGEEVLLVWRNGAWEQVSGRGEWRDAA